MLVTRRLARGCAAHPRRTVGIWIAAFVLALGSVATLLGSALTTEARITTSPDSLQGFDLLDDRLPGPAFAAETIVVRHDDRTVDDPAYRDFLAGLVSDLNATGVVERITVDVGAGDARVSTDRHATIVPVAMLDEDSAETDIEQVLAVTDAAAGDGFDVDITGAATGGHDFLKLSNEDLKKGELYFGLPAAMLVLLLVFGTVVAGVVPLLVAIICIPLTLGIAAGIGQVWELSFFVVNMVTAMGLALGVDYSLFIVSRYREERRAGRDKLAAIETAGATSSIAVLFSGASFTVALTGLLLVPDTTLRSLAAGAIITGIVTVAAALTLLPAVLSLLGDRVDSGRVPFVHATARSATSSEGRHWRRFVSAIMRRPAVSLTAAAGVLVLCALPVLGLETGQHGVGSLPDSLRSKQGFLALERSFPGSNEADPARVVIDGDITAPAVQDAMNGLRDAVAAAGGFGPAQISRLPEQRLAVIDIGLPGDPFDPPAERKLVELRDVLVPAAFADVDARAYVTGSTAFNTDYVDLLETWVPIVIAFVLALTFVLLTFVFRSIVLPLKAVLLNLLSVGAAYGLLVLVFQEGWGADLLGLTQDDTIEPWLPVFLFSVLFALSMDYHVFLLSRIREQYSHSGDTVDAVAHGIASTGRIITGAALIIVVVFAGFAAGEIVGFQQMGFGVAVALLIDATIVRSIIVPSSMALLGRWNWYLPRWLEWLPELQVEGRTDHGVIVLDEPVAAPAAGAMPRPRESADPRPAGPRHRR